jgi:hypothetical protein
MRQRAPHPLILIRKPSAVRSLFAQMVAAIPEPLRNLVRGPVRVVSEGQKGPSGLWPRPVELMLAPDQVLTTRLVLPDTNTSDLRNAVRLHIREATPFEDTEVLAIAELADGPDADSGQRSSRLTLVPLGELTRALTSARVPRRRLRRILVADPFGGHPRVVLHRPSGLWPLVPVAIIVAAATWAQLDHQTELATRLAVVSAEASAARQTAEQLAGELETRRQALLGAEKLRGDMERAASLYRFLAFARAELPEGNAVVRLDYGAGTVMANIETRDEAALLAAMRAAGFAVNQTMSQQSPTNVEERLVTLRVGSPT